MPCEEFPLSSSIKSYFQLARKLSLYELFRRAAGMIARRASRFADAIRDRWLGTYSKSSLSLYDLRFRIATSAAGTLALQPNNHWVERVLGHQFNLLGSGWFSANRSAKDLEKSGKFGGRWLAGCVVDSNLKESQRIWLLIRQGKWAKSQYLPIDWQVDIKSGFRWSGHCHYTRIAISPEPGVDIKSPWELSRMQHLPPMAIAAIHGVQRDECIQEIRAQILDFIATNPPRQGVNWACPMDVAIRVSNWLLAVDILQSDSVDLDKGFLHVFVRSIHEHAQHIVSNLEWAEEPRSNHYLADIVGLMFASAYLPSNVETQDWSAFAVREFIKELRLQFHLDGGCYEASTGYHRLSSEMAIFGVALLLGLEQEDALRVAAGQSCRLKVRPPQSLDPLPLYHTASGQLTLVPPDIVERLARMAELVADITKPDGKVVMIGDQDSGRFFKIDLAAMSDIPYQDEDPTDHRHLLSAAGALLGRSDLSEQGGRNWLDGSLIAMLAKRCLHSGPDTFSAHNFSIGSQQKLLAERERLLGLKESCRRLICIPLSGGEGKAIQCAAYPDFGVYVQQGGDFFLSVRCFDPVLPGVYGHSHDDNLSVEIQLAGEDLVTDPGTMAYTSFPELRNLYRSAEAHFAPRVVDQSAMRVIAPFLVNHQARGYCQYFGSMGFSGRLEGGDWMVSRLVLIEPDRILIIDGSEGGDLAPLAEKQNEITVAAGYGKKTERSICRI